MILTIRFMNLKTRIQKQKEYIVHKVQDLYSNDSHLY